MKNQIIDFGTCFFGSLVLSFAIAVVIPVIFFDLHNEFGIIFTALSSVSAPIVFFGMYSLCRKVQRKNG